MIPTIVIASLIFIAVAVIIIKGIQNKINGKHSCSCSGNCGACQMGCSNIK